MSLRFLRGLTINKLDAIKKKKKKTINRPAFLFIYESNVEMSLLDSHALSFLNSGLELFELEQRVLFYWSTISF